jgi:predicted DNA-binding transcriptional regulator AlpA
MTAMNSQTERRLYQIEQLPDVLQLSAPQVDWLVSTGQLRAIRICGEVRFDSNEVSELIATYNQIAKRKQNNVQ